MAAPECDRFGEDLSAHLDGELPQQRAAELEHHLLGCESCRAMFEQLRNVAERLADLPHMRAPDELTAAMRRAAERQVLLEARTPRTKTHVWKLFARVSASAALIAACMFAGWQVYEGTQRTSVTPTEHRLAKAPKGEPLSKESVGREVRSLDVAEAQPAEQPTGDFEPAAPALALADKTKGVEVEVPVEAWSDVSAREHLVAVGTEFKAELSDAPVVATTGGIVDVFITPQDAQQATAVRGTLAAWQEPIDAERDTGKRGGWYARGAPAAGVPLARVDRAGAAETTDRHEFVFQVTSAQANELIERLEQQAPRQVFLRYADLQRVQQPAEPEVADAEEEEQLLARGRFYTGDEARRVATPKRLVPRSPAEMPEETQERRGRGRGGEPPAPAKAPKKDERGDTLEGAAAAGGAPARPALGGGRFGGALGQYRSERAFQPTAPPTSQPLAAGEQPATQPTEGQQLRATVARLRDQLGELLFGTFVRAVTEAAQPFQPPPSQPVTVRVTLLAPPQAQTTQPARQPVPQP